VVIATPTHLHVAQALAAVRAGCDLFLEKPLAHAPEGIEELCAEIEKRRAITLVGCNLRFHPGPRSVHEAVAEGRIGRPLFARIHAGSYLPLWRPGRDYRETYSARAGEGGGVLLDFVHEIDLARWYLGEIREITCAAGRISNLEIDAEDWAALICRHENGAVSEIHLDYVQRSAERGCQIAGSEGSVFWDLRDGRVRLYRAPEDRWELGETASADALDRMYQEELAHLLECVASRRRTVHPVSEAARVMRVVFAARESARRGVPVPAPEGVSA
jgi:predicted dehydrogenase